MHLARKEGWAAQVLGIAPLPREAVRLGDWLLVPAHLDSSPVPQRAQQRIQALFAEGVRPKGFVLVHEAPLQLPAPEETGADVVEGEFWEVTNVGLDIDLERLGRGGLAVAGAVAKATLTLAMAIGTVVLPAIFMAGAALLDPILVMVTEENVWIEIDRWYV